MEMLDALERKVTDLLREVNSLRTANVHMEQQLGRLAVLADGTGETEQEKIYKARVAELELALAEQFSIQKTVSDRLASLAQRLEEQKNNPG